MPPQSRYVNLSSSHIIKTLSYQIKPNLSQLPPTVPTAKYPFLNHLLVLHKCKNNDQLNQIHAQMISTGLINNPLLSTKLVASFASNPLPGTTCVARSIADQIDGIDTYTWNTIIRGYLEGKNPKEAILVYAHMRKKGLKVDSYTLQFVTKACGLLPGVVEGEEIHGQILKMGFVSEIITVTSLLQMYGLFDNLKSARQVFEETPQRDIVLWNALVALYVQRDYTHMALLVSRSMVNENVRPNEVTAVSILMACSCLRSLREGKQVHSYMLKNLANLDLIVYNSLIGMYSKCHCLFSARRVFERMPIRNVVSWTTMINAYSDYNYMDEALALFRKMDSENVKPDEITMLGVVSMCSKIGSFEFAEWIDDYVRQKGFKEDSVCMANALMDMHAKCGNIKKACEIFDLQEEKTVVSWTTLIQGLAIHGHGLPALTRFCQMLREGLKPDECVFLSVLSACNHTGLVDEGRKFFRSMVEDHEMTPWMEHYGCMVDLLCRAGLVTEAFEFMEGMPVSPDVIMWRMLVGACRNQGNIGLANRIMNRLLELEPEDGGNYILLSNLYATIGEWDNVKRVRKEMEIRGISKSDPGSSFIEVN
ncbi:Pentatricopeptide repeat [Macleaya cordata]|uniref:Pentatricopeptide repeat n=1 Tax=Macleaya cordata TaxID=56857 RepID=A0A200QVE9_MACCD|nr:Pentatricopeptide repeat [Macleaya cordata]